MHTEGGARRTSTAVRGQLMEPTRVTNDKNTSSHIFEKANMLLQVLHTI